MPTASAARSAADSSPCGSGTPRARAASSAPAKASPAPVTSTGDALPESLEHDLLRNAESAGEAYERLETFLGDELLARASHQEQTLEAIRQDVAERAFAKR